MNGDDVDIDSDPQSTRIITPKKKVLELNYLILNVKVNDEFSNIKVETAFAKNMHHWFTANDQLESSYAPNIIYEHGWF